MRILICGSRDYRDAKQIYRWMENLPKDTIIIEGEAKGADTIAWVCASILGLEYLPFIADWNKLGKSAGPIRNQRMLDEGKPHWVVWFHKDLDASKGTKHMIEIAKTAGVNVASGEIHLG